jgi:preprotein translocase SecE subunit
MNLFTYLKETKAELKEVRFPSVSQTITFTVLVIVISLIVAVVLGGADFGFNKLLAFILAR